MITVEQCRAARGLLGWTQGDLAKACGLSKTAINNFEKGNGDIKRVSLEAVRQAFEREQVEFLEDNGLRRRSEAFVIMKGSAVFEDLLDDIIASLSRVSGEEDAEVLALAIDDRFLRHAAPDKVLEYLQALEKLNVTQRVLYVPGYDSFMGPERQSRWIDREILNLAPMTFIYADKVAWPLWGDAMILTIQSADINAAERKRFDFIWDISRGNQAGVTLLDDERRRKA
ncbi:MAG: helix-turn-helix domain-containing protein [Alphaproteobacteria bacterium]|nr:helix-turn-helix domain-containing protein [Alphaproteobacteria bacterium]